MKHIEAAIAKLAERHKEHILVYGEVRPPTSYPRLSNKITNARSHRATRRYVLCKWLSHRPARLGVYEQASRMRALMPAPLSLASSISQLAHYGTLLLTFFVALDRQARDWVSVLSWKTKKRDNH